MSQISHPDPAPASPPFLSIGALFAATALLAWAALAQGKRGSASVMPGDPGPYFMAHIAIAAILLAGVILCLQGLRQGPAALARPDLRAWRQPAIYVASLIFMPLAMLHLGTPLAVALFAFLWISGLARASGHEIGMALVLGALGGVAASAFTYGVFIRLLNLPLPV